MQIEEGVIVRRYAVVLTFKEKKRETRLIFQLGTVQSKGLNINLSFI